MVWFCCSWTQDLQKSIRVRIALSPPCTVNSRLADIPLLRTLAITDKIKIPVYRALTENDSRYYGLSLFRTKNGVPKVSAITRADCMYSVLGCDRFVQPGFKRVLFFSYDVTLKFNFTITNWESTSQQQSSVGVCLGVRVVGF